MLNQSLFSSKRLDWETPYCFFKELDDEFHFTLDPCCVPETAKCAKYYTPKENGLIQDWQGERVFCNPPYGRQLVEWVIKCQKEGSKSGTLVVMLIPARTCTAYFHKYIYKTAQEIRFIRGRIRFVGAQWQAPFPSMLVIYKTI
ncbi:phage N-6-adenine-methyltransferase [Sphingobacterium kyonggiense]|uniref:Phage N-6-adenine-methyltransferase n=1 Tax=Sphingobacterium kyonggiense TaxID=714075 RepID=A0ABP7Y7T7_9SPHI